MLAWSNRKLSYAGRLQLIQSVIKSVINFWSSVFKLPGKCLKIIDGLCSSFLWSGSPNVATKSKVAWNDVCSRRIEGGLGIRKLKDSSTVFSLNLIWRLVADSNSLWVKWINKYVLRGTNIWNAKPTTCGSWIWNKLLKLRSLAKGFICHKINSGTSTSFWDDNWSGMGRIIEITGEEGVRRLGIPRQSLVSEVGTVRRWCFRRCRDQTLRNLVDEINKLPLPDPSSGLDEINWKHGESEYRPYFSAKKTWEQICVPRENVSWSKVLWFGAAIPRHGFLSWITVKNRLSTGDRARSWGQTISCVLCGERNETRDHLFFACPYSYTVWTANAQKITSHTSPDWNTTLRDISGNRLPRMISLLYRILFQASIYHLWRERNNRRHQRQRRSVQALIATIEGDLTNRISSLSGDLGEGLKRRWDALNGRGT